MTDDHAINSHWFTYTSLFEKVWENVQYILNLGEEGLTFHSQEQSISNFPWNLARNIRHKELGLS